MPRILPYIFLFILLPAFLSAQAPTSFTWQGVARENGDIVTGDVAVRLQVRQSTADGTVVFSENVVTTSEQGVLSVDVGQSNPGGFSAINWAQGPYFLEVAIDPAGGANFQTLGSTQILSVPYALFARQSATALDDLDRDSTNELQTLSLNGQVLTLSKNGNSVTLPSAPVFSAGNGISINNNIITNTAPAVNPSLSLSGQILTVNPGGSNVTLPSGGGNEIWSEVNNFAQYTKNGARLFNAGTPDTLIMRPFSIHLKDNNPGPSLSLQKNSISVIESFPNGVDSIRISPLDIFLRSRIFTSVSETSYRNGRIVYGAQIPVFIIESTHANFTGSLGIGMDGEAPQATLEVRAGDALIHGHRLGRGPGGIASNTIFGLNAFNANLNASFTTAIGSGSAFSMTNGIDNTVVGADAMNTIVANNNRNVAVGSFAGSTNPQGSAVSNGTFVGFEAGPSGNASNASAFGNGARTTGNNQVRLGNAAVTSIGGAVGFSIISDGRYKTNVRENIPGLDFVLKLRPISYHLDVTGLSNFLHEDRAAQEHGRTQEDSPSEKSLRAREVATAMVRSGFIAQEVEDAARELGYDFSGVDKPANEESLYGLRYAEFVIPLVKAIQEQQELIRKLEARIKALEKERD